MNYTPILKEIIDYVENNINSVITLDEISANFFISKFHFHRIFKVYTGISFGQYISKRRLQYIGDDILNNKTTEIWKLILKYSYTQPQILNRTFKKHYNITPTQYRKHDLRKVIQEKLIILEKETISLNGKIRIDLSLEYFKKIKVYGIIHSIDLSRTTLNEEELIAFIKTKSQHFSATPKLKKFYYISIKRSKTIYTFGFFTDIKLDFKEHFTIPSGLYALLHYSGDRLYNSSGVVLNDIRSIFEKEHLTSHREDLEFIQQFFIDNPTYYSIMTPVRVNK
ncbi:MAG: AraC family transcriptional regulator [Psychrilyobacter sp.]|uniref:helix-turn-helix transcriptional regulator n=1 Tax=Psychrilyobacter sp. TaxID=2586924 RepID=UPI003C725843